MTFITIVNTPALNIATDQHILDKDQVRSVNNIHHLVKEIEALRDDQLKACKEAKEQGYENGYKEGMEKSYKESKHLFSEFLAKTSDEIINTHTLQRKDIVDLAIEITKKIVSNIESDEIVVGIAENAISHYGKKESIKIKVNSEIADKIKIKLSRKSTISDEYPKIEIVEDPKISELDCIIMSESGVTDASFDEQLKKLERHLVRNL
jgi:flagellar assembly protein FliH